MLIVHGGEKYRRGTKVASLDSWPGAALHSHSANLSAFAATWDHAIGLTLVPNSVTTDVATELQKWLVLAASNLWQYFFLGSPPTTKLRSDDAQTG